MFIRRQFAMRVYRKPLEENEDGDGAEPDTSTLDNAREDIGAAWDAVETATPEKTVATDSESGDRAAARARDEAGRFAAKQAEATAPAGVTPPPVVDPNASPAAPVVNDVPAPASWRQEGRDTWAAVPPAARAEIARREQEMAHHLQSTADVRRFGEVFGRTVQPFEPMLRGLGTNAMERVGVYLNTERVMTSGTPEQKAMAMAQFATQYGVDINMLDQALSHAVQGRMPVIQPGQQPQQQGEFKDPRFDAFLAEQRNREAQQVIQQVSGEIDTFWTGKEFKADLEGPMAMLMDGRAAERRYAAQQGQQVPPIMSLDEAYTLACRMNEKVFTIVQSRAAKIAAEKANETAAKARGASQGRGGNPSRSGGASSKVVSNDPRDELAAAWDAAAQR